MSSPPSSSQLLCLQPIVYTEPVRALQVQDTSDETFAALCELAVGTDVEVRRALGGFILHWTTWDGSSWLREMFIDPNIYFVYHAPGDRFIRAMSKYHLDRYYTIIEES